MATKNKVLLISIIAVVAVIVVGSVSVTYAWFLSRYSSEYEFKLEADEHVILQYETGLSFASGAVNDSGNLLVPAVSKSSAGLNQTIYTPIEMFNTTKVASSATAVHYQASGAYWTGSASTVGEFSFRLAAAVQGGNSSYNLVTNGEIAYAVVFHYLGKSILLYNGQYYTNEGTGTADFTLPSAITSDVGLIDWYVLSSAERVRTVNGVKYLLLTPNTEFEFDLYVFVGKTDELLDPAINGKTITLSATIAVN